MQRRKDGPCVSSSSPGSVEMPSSSVMSAKRKSFCETEKMLWPPVCQAPPSATKQHLTWVYPIRTAEALVELILVGDSRGEVDSELLGVVVGAEDGGEEHRLIGGHRRITACGADAPAVVDTLVLVLFAISEVRADLHGSRHAAVARGVVVEPHVPTGDAGLNLSVVAGPGRVEGASRKQQRARFQVSALRRTVDGEREGIVERVAVGDQTIRIGVVFARRGNEPVHVADRVGVFAISVVRLHDMNRDHVFELEREASELRIGGSKGSVR
eukprot:3936716-Rhodomonas_salina.3